MAKHLLNAASWLIRPLVTLFFMAFVCIPAVYLAYVPTQIGIISPLTALSVATVYTSFAMFLLVEKLPGSWTPVFLALITLMWILSGFVWLSPL